MVSLTISMNKSRMSLILNGFGASSIEQWRPGYCPLVGKYQLKSMTFLTFALIVLTKPCKINDMFDMSILSNQWVVARGQKSPHWLESMEMSKMSLILNCFVNKINENVNDAIDFKWFR